MKSKIVGVNENLSSVRVLIIPGIGGSGPDHWQTAWQRSHSNYKRVEQDEWNHPLCKDWVRRLEDDLDQIEIQPFIVAHSLGCLLVSQWAINTRHEIRGAFLVAPPDPKAAVFPAGAVGFSDGPTRRLPFPSILVASSNDPFASLKFSQELSFSWGSQFMNVGPKGHINAESHLGDWREGYSLFEEFISRTQIHDASDKKRPY